jgi:DNA-binding transcriptional regulator YhcF (GntR family)
MKTNGSQKRLETKTSEQRFKQMLEQEFHFAPKIAQSILEEAQAHLVEPSELNGAGRQPVILAKREAGHGRPLRETELIQVSWTVDAGLEDRQIGQLYGQKALRQVRIQRLLLEAIEQGVVASQEDLAQALQVTVRTIKRDFAELQEQGLYLPSRGNLHGIGRGQTHKAQIISCWLQGATYDQIAQRTHHALSSIQRYIQTFVRVVDLHQQDFSDSQIAQLLQLGLPLVQEYLAVYHDHPQPDSQRRLQEQMIRLKQVVKPKKGVV